MDPNSTDPMAGSWEAYIPIRPRVMAGARGTGRVKWFSRSVQFRRFRDAVRTFLLGRALPPATKMVAIDILLYEWNPAADLDNYLKSIMDCLHGIAFRDDSSLYIVRESIELARPGAEHDRGFRLRVEVTDFPIARPKKSHAKRDELDRKAYGMAWGLGSWLPDQESREEFRDRLRQGLEFSRGPEKNMPTRGGRHAR